MESRAIQRHTPTSPRKMRLVAGLVRGKRVEVAKSILENSTKHAARTVLLTLKSAVANYMQANPEKRADESELIVKKIYVDQGVALKRVMPAPMGRAFRVRKRSNHVTIVIDKATGAATKK
ncbi:MAG: 50S ribosomal protein L22 [Chlorobiales bacterium]|jgi:large subunit ribosomal protein L22|nr:50S ribosomal protein L22 [Chlorobiales bacterium]